MKVDLYTKVVLTLIVVLLAIIALKPSERVEAQMGPQFGMWDLKTPAWNTAWRINRQTGLVQQLNGPTSSKEKSITTFQP